jgi:hypothetical protein
MKFNQSWNVVLNNKRNQIEMSIFDSQTDLKPPKVLKIRKTISECCHIFQGCSLMQQRQIIDNIGTHLRTYTVRKIWGVNLYFFKCANTFSQICKHIFTVLLQLLMGLYVFHQKHFSHIYI